MGDGKFHVHEVLTGLESGEFVEILSGVSEGNRVVTSAQFMIDSEASINASIRRLESVEPQAGEDVMNRAFASGWVEDIDVNSHRIRIAHGPIDELGWPRMTMVFDALAGARLDTVKVGQEVQFVLLQQPGGEYALETIHPGAGGATGVSDDPEAVPAGHDHD